MEDLIPRLMLNICNLALVLNLLGLANSYTPEVVELPATSFPFYISTEDEGRPEPNMPEYILTEDEVALIAQLTQAEAGNQSEYGQRLVIDTVLNRMKDKHFPDSVRGVIFQEGQFSPASRLEKYPVKEEICKLVRSETVWKTNSHVIFFNAGHYSIYGVPMFQEGNHWFSSYN